MALRIVPFGAPTGFSDQAVAGAHYYSQGFSPSLFGTGTQYSIINKRDSTVVTGMGNIKYFALGPGGAMFAQDDAGHILKEQTPGAFDFTIVRSPGGNGCGLMGDQYGNLFYACGSSNNQLGKYDGTTWNDTYQSFSISTQHPMDWYEDNRLFADGPNIALLDASNVFNDSAFTLPSEMTIVAVKSGPTGILIGANLGYQGYIILWDGNALRAKTPWKRVKGQILSIEQFDTNWIVKHQRGVVVTNGVTVKPLFGTFDDPLSFKSYDNSNVLPQQMIVVNNTLIFGITAHSSGMSYEFGKMKPGIYLYSLTLHTWNYIPVPTGNTITLNIGALFADINYNNRVLVSYRDTQLGNNYIAQLINVPPSKAQYISEVVGVGRIHYQRLFFGPTDKTAEAVVLNLNPLNSATDAETLTFNVALKIYNFKRQLWGHATTNASITGNNLLQIDGTSASNYDAQVGDEVTILDGVNAGSIAHITAIANDAASNETWTLDTTFANQTENAVHLQVQPFVLVKKQTFTGLQSLKNIFWSVNGIKGKQFLSKFVYDGMGTNLAVEMQTSYFVFDDIGYDQTS
jgi:hypothetical protein